MPPKRQKKNPTPKEGNTEDVVSGNDASVAPGLGDVSPSNIINGARTRKGTLAPSMAPSE